MSSHTEVSGAVFWNVPTLSR